MENKKTFGAFILQRRRELGMTQKEFAEKLYVTESAVSKWERGLSYPDITLIRSICAVLDISEHELLTGAEDTKTRRSEQLAAKYLRMTRNYRVIQYVLYGIALLVCAICNLTTRHTLDWFFIAFFAVLTAASLTLLPAVTAVHPKLERCGGPVVFGSFTLCLLLLLLSCCLYTGGDWFMVAAVSVVFGLSLLVLPFLMARLPLPATLSGCKTAVYLILELFLLLLLLLVCCLYAGGDWFVIAAVSVVFGLGFFILPVLLRQLPLPGFLKERRLSAYLLVQTALLLLLLLVCQLHSGGDWFITAAVSVVFGLGFFILPVLLRQLPLPDALRGHKTLLYFSVQTLLLFLLLVIADCDAFLGLSLPVALICLLLPWGLMLTIRYLPISAFFRAAVCCAFSSLWFWGYPYALDRVMHIYSGESSCTHFSGMPYPFPALKFDFFNWTGSYISFNVYAIIIFSLLLAAVILAALGIAETRRGSR